MSETFSLSATITPDYGIATNWSGGSVPGAGTDAVIDDATVLVDPATVLSANVVLQGVATLSGNGGGFSLGPGSALAGQGQNALYADGAIVNDGAVTLAGGATVLRIVVEDGTGIAENYGLAIPSFENAGDIAATGGATLAIDGTELSNIGEITLDDGTLAVSGGAVDGGQGPLSLGGLITLADHATASFSDGVADQDFSFTGADTISFADAAGVTGVTITGFDRASKILVPSLAAGHTLLDQLTFTDLPGHTVPVVLPALAGAEISLEPTAPCFARGTRLLTPAGYAPVEALRPGDPLVTLAGDIKPARWIGSRALDLAAHVRPDAVRPVRILPGALGPGVPARHVRLSPDHALLLRGLLVPVKLLVNGATILRERNCQAVTYYHVELDRHDILLAEKLPVESYLDTGNRAMFETAAGVAHKSPVFGRGRQWDSRAFADLCLGGTILAEIRRGLRARAFDMGFRPRTLTDVSLWAGGRKFLRAAGTASRPIFKLGVGHPGEITIRSPVFVPAEMTCGDGDDEDNRLLGIALKKIRFGLNTVLPARIARAGFHPRAARDAADWTDGNAIIEVPPQVGTVSLVIAALPQGWTTPPGAIALDI
jgi:hypothetical protein